MILREALPPRPAYHTGRGCTRVSGGDVGNPDPGGLFLKPESRSSPVHIYNLVARVPNTLPPGKQGKSKTFALTAFFCVLSALCMLLISYTTQWLEACKGAKKPGYRETTQLKSYAVNRFCSKVKIRPFRPLPSGRPTTISSYFSSSGASSLIFLDILIASRAR